MAGETFKRIVIGILYAVGFIVLCLNKVYRVINWCTGKILSLFKYPLLAIWWILSKAIIACVVMFVVVLCIPALILAFLELALVIYRGLNDEEYEKMAGDCKPNSFAYVKKYFILSALLLLGRSSIEQKIKSQKT